MEAMNDQPEPGLNFYALSRAGQYPCTLRGSRDSDAHLSSEDLARLKDVGLVDATDGVNPMLTAIGAGAGSES